MNLSAVWRDTHCTEVDETGRQIVTTSEKVLESQMTVSMFLRNSRKAVFGLATAAIALTAVTGVAEAKHKKHFGIVLNFGVPAYGYSEPGYSSCWWLKKKAINTGSSYWWKRYHYCIYG